MESLFVESLSQYFCFLQINYKEEVYKKFQSMNEKSPQILYQISDPQQRSKSLFNPMGSFFEGSPPKLTSDKPTFEECKIFQDDQHLVLVTKQPEGYEIVRSINYKNIIEM